MEQLNWQERVKKSGHPSRRGFFPIKERALLDDFQENADGLNPAGHVYAGQQSTDDSEVGYDFWRISRNYIYRHHVQPLVKLFVPKEGSFLQPLKYIDVVRRTYATVDVLLENRINDCWDVDGDRELPGRGTVSPSSHYRTKSLERLTKGQATSMPDY